MTQTQIADRIVSYIKTNGRCPNFSSIGTTWKEGNEVFAALLANGTLVYETRTSPKGRKTKVIRLG